ncbi:hypothetical protein BKA64DRAFT_243741 [Cadophora sp. MPI-SDFR-AT-0126]|nr:hypothetical protein BKA64DRAFT_243741 [Leotiomycetes sp. MPI-SDFR-AT-0126]
MTAFFAVVLTVFFFSVLPLRTRLYEIFLVMHILLAIVALIGLWNHVTLRFHKARGYQTWLYIAFAFWGFDRVIRPLRIVMLNWKTFCCRRHHPSATVELLPGSSEFVKVTVFPSVTWNFSAGQHCYLYFPKMKTNPFQSHPFSIVGWNQGFGPGTQTTGSKTSTSSSPQVQDAPGMKPVKANIELSNMSSGHQNGASMSSKPSVTFIIRPKHGLTKTLHSRLLQDSRKSLQVKNITALVEGPYGSSPLAHFHNADTIVAIAGGIGITAILGYLQMYLSSKQPSGEGRETALRKRRGVRATRFVLEMLHWATRGIISLSVYPGYI